MLEKESKENKRKKKEKGRKIKTKVCVLLRIKCVLISYGFSLENCPLGLGFCGRDHPNLRIVEVLWVKPQMYKKNMESSL